MTKRKKDLPLIRRKRWYYLTCRFCSTRDAIPDSQRDLKTGDYCSLGKRRVFRDSESCKDFELTQSYFWCDEYNQRLDLKVCLHRRNGCKYGDYHEVCPKCHEGKALDVFINGSGIKYRAIDEVDDEG